jgi:predicted unusual protein kinase regulating ubiquinone biosynthesis (AarF/ABC1/UbiB family)
LFVKFDEYENPTIIILDVGLVSRLKPKDKENLINLFTSISLGKGYEAAELLIDKSQSKEINEYTKKKNENFKIELGRFFQFLFSQDTG